MFEPQDDTRLATESLGLTAPPETVEASTSITLTPDVLLSDAVHSEIDDNLATQTQLSLLKGNLVASMESGDLTRRELTAYNYTLRACAGRVTGLSQEDYEFDDDLPVDVGYDLTMESLGVVLSTVGQRLLEALKRYLTYLVDRLTSEATIRVNIERIIPELRKRLKDVSSARPDYRFNDNLPGIADLTYDGEFDTRGLVTYPLKDAILIATTFNNGNAANRLFSTKVTDLLTAWAGKDVIEAPESEVRKIPANTFKPWEALEGLSLGGFQIDSESGQFFTVPCTTVEQVSVKQKMPLPTLDEIEKAIGLLSSLSGKLGTLGEYCEQTRNLIEKVNKAVTALYVKHNGGQVGEISAALVQAVLIYCRSFILTNSWLTGMSETTAKVLTNALDCYE